MTLLKYDYSGAVDAEYGVTSDQLDDLFPTIAGLRDEVVNVDDQRHGLRFARLPREMLDGYETHREQSELGRIFNIANRLHDQVDTTVVLGVGGSYFGVRALMDACCHPYHNELSRGGRGSKPRMYFGGNSLDNDACQGLLDLLDALGSSADAVEPSWATIVVDSSDALETFVTMRQFVAALAYRLGDNERRLLPELVIPVTGPTSKLKGLANEIGCGEVLSIPAGIDDSFSVLSSAGVLPAAVLGLDCIQLLEGASAMYEHFNTAPPEDNLVVQYVAMNHLLQFNRGVTLRVMSVWANALESVGHWYANLLSASHGKHERGVTPLTTVNTRDLQGRHLQHVEGRSEKVINNLIVDSCCADPLKVGENDRNGDGLNDIADKMMPDLLSAAFTDANEALNEAGRPTTDIVLPEINTHTLGQLFQMLMLATVLEDRLLSIRGSGQQQNFDN